MSTNPKDLNPIEASKAAIEKSKRSTDRTLRALQQDMEQENTLVPETQNGRIARLLKIYNGIRPLLTVISALPLIPSTWRAALALFNNALAAVAAGAEDVSTEFKAGKDL